MRQHSKLDAHKHSPSNLTELDFFENKYGENVCLKMCKVIKKCPAWKGCGTTADLPRYHHPPKLMTVGAWSYLMKIATLLSLEGDSLNYLLKELYSHTCQTLHFYIIF